MGTSEEGTEADDGHESGVSISMVLVLQPWAETCPGVPRDVFFCKVSDK